MYDSYVLTNNMHNYTHVYMFARTHTCKCVNMFAEHLRNPCEAPVTLDLQIAIYNVCIQIQITLLYMYDKYALGTLNPCPSKP